LTQPIVALEELKIKRKVNRCGSERRGGEGSFSQIAENKKAQPQGLGQEMEKQMPVNRAL
jgi:hypothetical protein